MGKQLRKPEVSAGKSARLNLLQEAKQLVEMYLCTQANPRLLLLGRLA